MMHQRWVVTALLGAVVFTGACGKKEPPAPPAPTVNQDSIDAARRRQEEMERQRQAELERQRQEQAARERAMAEARRAREVLGQVVHFDFDQSQIRADAQDVLTQKVAVLRAYPGIKLRIAGHADERGSTEYNLALGQRRAQAVKDYFANYGLDASRFETVSYGEERPVAMGHDESAWSQNRRDEFTITAGADALNP